LLLACGQKRLTPVPKPDQSGSGSSPEVTESGTETRQKSWTVHFPILNTNIFNLKTNGLWLLASEALPFAIALMKPVKQASTP